MIFYWIFMALEAATIGVLFYLGFIRSKNNVEVDLRPTPDTVELSEDLRTTLELFKEGSFVVSDHDLVLFSNTEVDDLAIIKGSRVQNHQILELIRQARRKHKTIVTELELTRGLARNRVPVHIRLAPLGAGAVVILIQDISELRLSDESRRDFVANTSHELKTPIGAISVLAEAVEMAAERPERVVHFAKRMQSESKRLADLVTQIIDLSRVQSKSRLSEDMVNISRVVTNSLERNRELSRKRKINFVTSLNDDLWVVGDESELANAVSNLIHNAISYSDEGTKIAVTVLKTVDNEITLINIAVSDNGIGIKDEDIKRIFERFYRVDYGRSRCSGGSGLGLSIVKQIAIAHGGTINVWSKYGQGSTFTLKLPAAINGAKNRDK